EPAAGVDTLAYRLAPPERRVALTPIVTPHLKPDAVLRGETVPVAAARIDVLVHRQATGIIGAGGGTPRTLLRGARPSGLAYAVRGSITTEVTTLRKPDPVARVADQRGREVQLSTARKRRDMAVRPAARSHRIVVGRRRIGKEVAVPGVVDATR